MARPDVPVVLPAAEVHLGLLHPFRGEADSRQDAESLLGADHGAVHPACPDKAGAIPEGLRGLTAAGAGKLAVHEPRPADAVPDHPDLAWVLFLERLALGVPAERSTPQPAAVAQYKPDAAQSVA